MTKFLGIILASIFSVILIVQVEQVSAQLADSPITGPITSPITGSLTSPTDSPTPTLIDSLTSTPTLTATPTPTAIPTPLPTNVTRLGGLNLDGYCVSIGKDGDTVANGDWYCGNGSAKIDMSAACQWQNARTDTFAFQDRAGDIYSWSCYTTTPTVTPTASVTIAPTVIPTATATVTPTTSVETTPTDMPTVIPTPSNHNSDHFPFRFHGFSFDAIINAIHFFQNKSHGSNHKDVKLMTAKACSIHDADDQHASSHSHNGNNH